ncbi:uncharacterized protein AUP68_03909 [Ilyonectria robusta]
MQLLEVYEHPHPCSGLLSLRPSFDSTSTKAIPANSPKFEMVGQFGRSLDDPHYIVSHTFENIHQSFSGFPFRISLTNKPGGLGKMSPPKSTRLTCRDLKSSETGSTRWDFPYDHAKVHIAYPTCSSAHVAI